MSVRIYCGKSNQVPQGYGRIGTPFECMRCGFGAAMRKYRWTDADQTNQPHPQSGGVGCRRGVRPNEPAVMDELDMKHSGDLAVGSLFLHYQPDIKMILIPLLTGVGVSAVLLYNDYGWWVSVSVGIGIMILVCTVLLVYTNSSNIELPVEY